MAATTKEQVDNMSARDRLWDSLSYGYGKQIEQSNANYDQSASQLNNTMLKRGMQRSSYGMQTYANLLHQKNQAANDLGKAMISEYGNRLYQIERDEVADEQWQKGFDEGVRQFNENMGFQRERATVQDRQWQMGFDEGVRQFNENMAWNRESAAASNALQQASLDSQNAQWRADYDFRVQQYMDSLNSKNSGGGGNNGGNKPKYNLGEWPELFGGTGTDNLSGGSGNDNINKKRTNGSGNSGSTYMMK